MFVEKNSKSWSYGSARIIQKNWVKKSEVLHCRKWVNFLDGKSTQFLSKNVQKMSLNLPIILAYISGISDGFFKAGSPFNPRP